jgi:hypothetical protein
MEEINTFLKNMGINIGYALAGIFGSMALLSDKQELSLRQKSLIIVTGVGTANYLAPMIIYVMHVPQQFSFGFAFLLGYSGVATIKYFIMKYKLNKGGKEN